MSNQMLDNHVEFELIDESIDPEEIYTALRALNNALSSIRSQTIRSDLRNAYDRISRLVIWES